jgi:hypothetical protein
LIKHLKSRLLGLAAIQRCRARQRSKVTWLKHGDANTKFFHITVNARRKKNFIHSLHTEEGIVVSQADKHKIIFDHFSQHIGSYAPRSCALNFESLGWQPRSLQHLDQPVSKTELKMIIQNAPKEKALGPDGFIGLFFLVCWDTIKEDAMMDVNHFLSLNQQGLHLLNQAFIVLIPKKGSLQQVSDYKPISLIHSFAKITFF